jgi:Cu/Ag efflux protein CusF
MAQFSRRTVSKVLAASMASAALFLVAAAQAQESATTGIFHGVGTIAEVNQEKRFITVDHGEIKGFMAAMIMTYNVTPAAMSPNLRKGDRIEFDIDAANETIVAIVVKGHED